MTWVREPAVAGLFYPEDADDLAAAVATHLDGDGSMGSDDGPGDDAGARPDAVAPSGAAGGSDEPRALIAPHAGYRYSGAAAGAAYRTLAEGRGSIDRVVLVGPAHRVAVDGPGVGASTARAWRTPVGDVPVDVDTMRGLVADGLAVAADAAHAPEHSLEVHLPFLLAVLGPVPVVPLVVGGCPPRAVAAVLDATWGDGGTLVVVSSDLSHYLSEAEARTRDDRTRRAIIEGRAGDIGPRDACGSVPIAGLVLAATTLGVVPRTVAMATSADASGDTGRVVGYGSFAFATPQPLSAAERTWLLARARAAVAHEVGGAGMDPLVDSDVDERLSVPGASFVTVEVDGALAGCIGSLEATRPLWQDVARNARSAAFADPRFEPLSAADLDTTVLKVSVLSRLEPLPSGRDELIAAVRPGVDGVLIEAGDHRATFLPTVWEKLPQPEGFVAALAAKAGLAASAWPVDLQAWRYTTDEFSE